MYIKKRKFLEWENNIMWTREHSSKMIVCWEEPVWWGVLHQVFGQISSDWSRITSGSQVETVVDTVNLNLGFLFPAHLLNLHTVSGNAFLLSQTIYSAGVAANKWIKPMPLWLGTCSIFPGFPSLEHCKLRLTKGFQAIIESQSLVLLW